MKLCPIFLSLKSWKTFNNFFPFQPGRDWTYSKIITTTRNELFSILFQLNIKYLIGKSSNINGSGSKLCIRCHYVVEWVLTAFCFSYCPS